MHLYIDQQYQYNYQSKLGLQNYVITEKKSNITEDDLYALAGHILSQPNIVAEKWGGGKIYY